MFENAVSDSSKKTEKVNEYKLEKQRRSEKNRLSGRLSRCE